jgi:hypothetical protein
MQSLQKPQFVVVKLESFEASDTFLRCGDDTRDYLFTIVAIEPDGSAEIVDSGYRTFDVGAHGGVPSPAAACGEPIEPYARHAEGTRRVPLHERRATEQTCCRGGRSLRRSIGEARIRASKNTQ